MRDWIAGVAHVVDNDPNQADEEAGEHQGSKPLRALLR